MNTLSVINIIASLYKIVEAGEWGYGVAASNVSNRVLKARFKSHARKRLEFKEELWAELQRLGCQTKPQSSILGIVHRGRINIFAALTIGAENVEKTILKEVILGERVALRSYEKVLKKDLPPETKIIVERQFRNVLETVNEIQLLRGRNGKRLLIRLYDSKPDAEVTLLSLNEADVPIDSVEIKDFNEVAEGDVYDQDGRGGAAIFETMVSGAVGGATWGVVAGILSIIGILRISALNQDVIAPVIPLFAFLGLVAGGIFIGGMLGLFIGWGISSEDQYVSQDITHGKFILQVLEDESQASAAWKIMYQVATQERGRRVSEPSA
jgi:uncharacterized protein (TIGR02284 family)